MLDEYMSDGMIVIYNINDGDEEAKLFYQSNIDTWWVSQDERIFVCLSNYFGQYFSNTGNQK